MLATKASTAVTFNDRRLVIKTDILRCRSKTKYTDFRTHPNKMNAIFPDQLFYVLKVMDPWPTSLQSLKPSWILAYI